MKKDLKLIEIFKSVFKDFEFVGNGVKKDLKIVLYMEKEDKNIKKVYVWNKDKIIVVFSLIEDYIESDISSVKFKFI